MKRFISAVLLLTVFVTAVACGDEKKPSDETTNGGVTTTAPNQETTNEAVKDDLPEGLDFNDAKIVVHTRGDYNSYDEVFVEATEDQVSEAIYKRNSVVENRLSVIIEAYRGADWSTYYDVANTQLRASISSGDGAFDIVSGWQPCIPELATEGLMTDLNTLDYIGKEKPYWTQSLVKELEIAERLYFITGDISVFTMLGSMRLFVCNSTLAKANEIPDLYKVVNDGDWTIEYVNQLVKGAYKDDGDGIINATDTYGLLMGCANDCDGFLASAQIRMTSLDDNKIPYLNMPVQRLNELVEGVYGLMYENEGTLVTPADAAETAFSMMKEDKLLLAPFPLDTLRLAFNDMKSDFMVLPYPKLNDSQKNYGTRIQDALQIWGIPIDIMGTDLEAASATLEALAFESYTNVTPVYFDTALKGRYTRDEESKLMMDLIKNSVFISFEMIYNNYVGNPGYVIRNMMSLESKDFMSYWGKRQEATNEAFNKTIQLLINPSAPTE